MELVSILKTGKCPFVLLFHHLYIQHTKYNRSILYSIYRNVHMNDGNLINERIWWKGTGWVGKRYRQWKYIQSGHLIHRTIIIIAHKINNNNNNISNENTNRTATISTNIFHCNTQYHSKSVHLLWEHFSVGWWSLDVNSWTVRHWSVYMFFDVLWSICIYSSRMIIIMVFEVHWDDKQHWMWNVNVLWKSFGMGMRIFQITIVNMNA